jgi:hypothetical protein
LAKNAFFLRSSLKFNSSTWSLHTKHDQFKKGLDYFWCNGDLNTGLLFVL